MQKEKESEATPLDIFKTGEWARWTTMFGLSTKVEERKVEILDALYLSYRGMFLNV